MKTKSKKAKAAKASKAKTRAGNKTAKKTSKRTTKAAAKPSKAATSTPAPTGAIVGGTDPCVCGGAPEDHGRDPEYPGSTACTHCTDCIAYEADHETDEAGA